ncbi:hypothetical protein EPO66_03075, partial [bacterium]
MDNYSELNLSEIFAIIKRRYFTFVMLVLVVFFVCGLVTFMMPPTYKASAKIVVHNESNLYPKDVIPGIAEDSVFLKTQKEIISSSFIINKALQELRQKGMFKGKDYKDLKNNIKIDYLNDSNLLEIKVYYGNEKEAAGLANAIVSTFLNYHSNAKLELVDGSLAVLSKEIAYLKNTMDELKAQLKERSAKDPNFYEAQIPSYVNSIINITDKNDNIDGTIGRMQTELAKTDTVMRRGGKDAFYYPLMTGASFSDKQNENPTSSLTDLPWLDDLKTRLSTAEANLARLTSEFNGNHPEAKRLNKEMENLRENINKEVKNVLATYKDYYSDYIKYLKSQKDLNETTKKQYSSKLKGIVSNMDEAMINQIEFNNLLNNLVMVQEFYGVLFKKEEDLNILRSQFSRDNLSNFKVFESAELPLEKTSPILPLNLGLGLFLGMFVGLFASLNEEKKTFPGNKNAASSPSNKEEQRSMSRIEKSFTVAYALGSGVSKAKGYAVTENISGSGINIKLKENIEIGTEISLKINMSQTDSISATGKVVWVIPPLSSSMFETGIHFTKIDSQ